MALPSKYDHNSHHILSSLPLLFISYHLYFIFCLDDCKQLFYYYCHVFVFPSVFGVCVCVCWRMDTPNRCPRSPETLPVILSHQILLFHDRVWQCGASEFSCIVGHLTVLDIGEGSAEVWIQVLSPLTLFKCSFQ